MSDAERDRPKMRARPKTKPLQMDPAGQQTVWEINARYAGSREERRKKALLDRRRARAKYRQQARTRKVNEETASSAMAFAVWEMHVLDGKTKNETMLALGLEREQFDDYLHAMMQERTRRLKTHAQDFVALQVARLDWVIEQAVSGYVASKAGKRTIERTIKDGQEIMSTEKLEQTKAGEPKFLTAAMIAMRNQADLLGLIGAPNMHITQQIINLSAQERLDRMITLLSSKPADDPPGMLVDATKDLPTPVDAEWSWMDDHAAAGRGDDE